MDFLLLVFVNNFFHFVVFFLEFLYVIDLVLLLCFFATISWQGFLVCFSSHFLDSSLVMQLLRYLLPLMGPDSV